MLAVLAVIAAGCSSPADTPASPGPSAAASSSAAPVTSSPAPASPIPTTPDEGEPTAKPGSAAMLPLDFTRTGGFAGVDDHLTIAADGAVTIKRRSATAKADPLSAAKLAELQRLLADPALTSASQPPANRDAVCADGFIYRFRTPSWTLLLDNCGGTNRPAVERLLKFIAPLL